eukprot:CAMPEP_0169288514 /NCGR_PEP_ID=MMETSP1016-20121227/60601_1 /TAXON_ID=342587 /ORGANISM="Karlodinium micrum, Strain CCMP2283" /LENGTH=55 /DNA_ID=CAMNT_0009378751 /DNA_START=68 /DNA_END=235 /DNA_ORIENTATION=+
MAMHHTLLQCERVAQPCHMQARARRDSATDGQQFRAASCPTKQLKRVLQSKGTTP